MRKRVCNNNIMLTIGLVLFFSLFLFGGMHFVSADKGIEYEKNFKTIEIEYGDTLLHIAEQYAISEADYEDYIAEIKSINNLRNDTIDAGCYLMIPVYQESQNSLVTQN